MRTLLDYRLSEAAAARSQIARVLAAAMLAVFVFFAAT
jgi:hypothetical protein